MAFPHEKLLVYQKALGFFGDIQPYLSGWSKQHAVVDHLLRASESVLYNLVEGVRLQSMDKKLLTMDYAIGSVLECAACLDIAVLKQLLDGVEATSRKGDLLEVGKMLVGLRNSWGPSRVAEEGPSFELSGEVQPLSYVFYHETMDRYQVALESYQWLVGAGAKNRLPGSFEKSADTLATRIVLNIAESNGRYASLSRQSFLDTANAATAKLAVLLDMGVHRGILSPSSVESGKALLVRVGQMTAKKAYPSK